MTEEGFIITCSLAASGKGSTRNTGPRCLLLHTYAHARMTAFRNGDCTQNRHRQLLAHLGAHLSEMVGTGTRHQLTLFFFLLSDEIVVSFSIATSVRYATSGG